VQAGGGEDGHRAVGVGDQQFDLGAAEDDTFGAGLDQANDGVAVGLTGLFSDRPRPVEWCRWFACCFAFLLLLIMPLLVGPRQ